MAQPRRALVRALPQSYRTYYDSLGIEIDFALAETQHMAYAGALAAAGLAVTPVEAAEEFPDCVFIEDTAIVWNDRALVTRMVARREGEQAAVTERLRDTHEIVTLVDGARLEGGDVLHVDDITYVGLTERTNTAGIAALRFFLAPFNRTVVAVPCTRCLHLKTAATYLGNGTLLLAPGLLDVTQFTNLSRVIETPAHEAHAANTIRVGDHLLVQGGYPATETLLRGFAEAHGVTVWPVDTSEFAKGDGSLTCLSIIL